MGIFSKPRSPRRIIAASLAVVCILLFVAGNIPHPDMETLPWVFFAIVASVVAAKKQWTRPSSVSWLLQEWREDKWFAWHVVAGVLVSAIGTMAGLGLLGVVPIATTYALLHPHEWVVGWKNWEGAMGSGDQVWPFVLMCGLWWPWTFCIARCISRRAPGLKSLFYILVVLILTVVGTVGSSRLILGNTLLIK